ncbi:ankyrin repeat domain-containing protein [Paraburkholderia hayleyella]|uniref:ankyrin repeat domain-containing protein n=1 Tax=Paraburkholderia hayleyella TaxID=2152889 RepID=UPI00158021C3|nr:ankyrin repeat domain-containing protein [Paraburkholderia hayleyella]
MALIHLFHMKKNSLISIKNHLPTDLYQNKKNKISPANEMPRNHAYSQQNFSASITAEIQPDNHIQSQSSDENPMQGAAHETGTVLHNARPQIDPQGRSPLHLVVLHQGENLRLVDLLICHNHALLDAQDNELKTAMHYAVIRGNLYLTWKLIYRGANLFLRDNAGKTALDYAKDIRAEKLIALLENSEKQCNRSITGPWLNLEALRLLPEAPITQTQPGPHSPGSH